MSEMSARSRLRLYLMRHGEVERSADSVSYGRTDVALSARGMEQSRWLRKILAGAAPAAVYSSDLIRAVHAAELIAQFHKLSVISLAALREIDMGDWEGRSLAEMSAARPELVSRLLSDPREFRYPGGESFLEFEHRVQGVLKMILTTHEHGEVAVVTHGGVCRLIIGSVLDLPPKNWLRLAQGFGCLNIIDWYEGSPIIQTVNQTLG